MHKYHNLFIYRMPGTRYSSNAAFAEIEAEYLVFSSNYNYISLLGDFK